MPAWRRRCCSDRCSDERRPALTHLHSTPRMPRMHHLPRRLLRVGLMVIAMCVALAGAEAGRAHAEPSADDKSLASLLFQQGRALTADGREPADCLKPDDSHRLDPAGATT